MSKSLRAVKSLPAGSPNRIAKSKGGCMAVMEEVGNGTVPAHLRDTDQSLMHHGHDLWLATLRWMSESVGG